MTARIKDIRIGGGEGVGAEAEGEGELQWVRLLGLLRPALGDG